MKLYLIGGLGADERVFQYLNFEFPVQNIKWLPPNRKEKINDYVKRLSSQIDTENDFIILGVSFGGLVAIELAKISTPKLIVLISSIETHNQLPKLLVALGKIGLLNLVPNSLIKPPRFLRNYLFSAKNKVLLDEIIKDTDPNFIRWALTTMINWKNKSNPFKTIRIHGTNDRLIPRKGNAIEIKGGGHFMVVDNANELSEIINKEINNSV